MDVWLERVRGLNVDAGLAETALLRGPISRAPESEALEGAEHPRAIEMTRAERPLHIRLFCRPTNPELLDHGGIAGAAQAVAFGCRNVRPRFDGRDDIVGFLCAQVPVDDEQPRYVASQIWRKRKRRIVAFNIRGSGSYRYRTRTSAISDVTC